MDAIYDGEGDCVGFIERHFGGWFGRIFPTGDVLDEPTEKSFTAKYIAEKYVRENGSTIL